MARPVVVTLDSSPFAEDALPMAVQLARRLGAPVHLVLVHQPPSSLMAVPELVGTMAATDQALREVELAYLAAMRDKVATDHDLAVEAVALEGPVVRAIAAHVTSADARVVVMCTHGRGGLSRLFLGSVADRLTRELHCPILLIRPGGTAVTPRLGVPRRILVPLDGSRLAEAMLDQVVAIFGAVETEFELVRVVVLPPAASPMAEGFAPPQEVTTELVADAEAYLLRVAGRLEERGLTVTTACHVGEAAASVVVEEVERRQPDLVAMATRGLSTLERTMLGSVTDKVLRSAAVPVLTWNPPTSGASSRLLD